MLNQFKYTREYEVRIPAEKMQQFKKLIDRYFIGSISRHGVYDIDVMKKNVNKIFYKLGCDHAEYHAFLIHVGFSVLYYNLNIGKLPLPDRYDQEQGKEGFLEKYTTLNNNNNVNSDATADAGAGAAAPDVDPDADHDADPNADADDVKKKRCSIM